MIQHKMDDRVIDLEEDDVELAKLLLADVGDTFADRKPIIKQFHESTGSLGKAVAIVSCALKQMVWHKLNK